MARRSAQTGVLILTAFLLRLLKNVAWARFSLRHFRDRSRASARSFSFFSEILTPRQVQQAASDEIKTEFAPESAVRAFMAQNPDIGSAIDTGYHVRSYGDSRDPSVYNDVLLPFDGNYTFTDKATGKTFSPSTPEELRAITQAANGMSTIGTAPMKDSNYGGGNNTANWEITRGEQHFLQAAVRALTGDRHAVHVFGRQVIGR